MEMGNISRARLALLVFLVPFATRSTVAEDSIKPAATSVIEELAGRWKPVSALYNNEKLPRARLGPAIVILIVDERPTEVCIEFQTEPTPSYLDADALYDKKTKRNLMNLRSRVVFSEDPPDVLYKIEGNRLVVVQDMGSNTFPKDFTSRPGDKKSVRVYERMGRP